MPLDFEGDLNPEQLRAVQAVSGPCLVLAGAGSGKTRVITYKMAYLISKCRMDANRILAVTFTNKAAAEMRSRVDALIGTDSSPGGLWIGTFHSVCARILRQQIGRLDLGYTSKFTIIDQADQERLLRNCIKDLNLDPKRYQIRDVASRISDDKAQGIAPEALARYQYRMYDEGICSIYKAYQRHLEKFNALDFDDLLSLVVRLFDEHHDVQEYYAERFTYVLVDEYQDVNEMQYQLVWRLTHDRGNVTVVGDDDQSIYAFRGAKSEYILGFAKDFPNTTVIKLEQNYRSTQGILDAANALMAHAERRYAKDLWTQNGQGEAVVSFEAASPQEEGKFVANHCQWTAQSGLGSTSIAVLYRSNSQSRVVEDALMASGIPYRILGGLRFYERKEIKDALSYLRLACNAADDLAFERAISWPRRGLGKKGLEDLKALARERGESYFAALRDYVSALKPSKGRQRLAAFVETIEATATASPSAIEAVAAMFRSSGLLESYQAASDAEDLGVLDREAKKDNLEELLRMVGEFDAMSGDKSLEAYLSQAALVQDQDSLMTNENTPVVLATAHAVKGLEFDWVFVVGAEEGLFPHVRAQTFDEVQEERRLFYVACTRAKKRLFITHCAQRQVFHNRAEDDKSFRDFEGRGSWLGSELRVPSRFLRDMHEHVQPTSDIYADLRGGLESVAGGASESAPSEFIRGDSVMHNVYGAGVVTEVYKEGSEMRLVIDFKKKGIMKLDARYAHLTKMPS